MSGEQPVYQRIAGELRRRIVAGELRAGERVPSTRAVMREWGVAMATATKALTVLREEGLVRAVSGSGTVVSGRSSPRRAGSGAESGLSRELVVRAAIVLADAEGRAALSMRRLAAELGVGPMSLYRQVPDKDELLRLMADTAFGAEELPEPGPSDWRERLRLSARVQWRAYRRHPWLAPELLNSLTDPPVVPSGIRHLDWCLRGLGGLGLDEPTMLRTVVTLNGYIGGMALSRSLEVETEQQTGVPVHHRAWSNDALAAETVHSGRFPSFAGLTGRIEGMGDLDELFEFGLARHLDGIAALVG
ncbi:TetR/AcrR family transcriptional regulator C-terminal domain-containing protein [Saccharopolyspora sp. HNM0983]|uniref:TetR/AcrR family transcriptional regulator C-terminal domain-containing protein n=1 Tax=Saccharopolyspora montiporae TaxID=2781240 RepID=A0A929B7K6_9PSEU|nr:TetR/AcrR family transcriptional regulator C-terminal domain-containing protein [Saccharopolyspora sp. HNM0983]MBE9372881.1 TetR/AcrR family transcriptional regulator C-terminal domain-containing protein [Saccharopolyspora sp. HNM0983]